jgi:predicted CopG family antitoxin
MKNITITVDDETYRKARIYAAEKDTSVSALFKDFLRGLKKDKAEFDRLKALQEEVRSRLGYFSVSDTLTRQELYDERR